MFRNARYDRDVGSADRARRRPNKAIAQRSPIELSSLRWPDFRRTIPVSHPFPAHSPMQSHEQPISALRHDNELARSVRDQAAAEELVQPPSPDIATQNLRFCKLYISRLVEDFAVPQRTARLTAQRNTEAAYTDVLLAISSFLANSPSPQNPINFTAIADKEAALKALIVAQSCCIGLFRVQFENRDSFVDQVSLLELRLFSRLNAFLACFIFDTEQVIAASA